MVDEASLKKYSRVKGSFGSRLHNSIDWREGAFKRYEERCAFLDEDNLCDIYKELGPEGLCRTCRTYPRHIEEFEGVREMSLCLSCIEAARMVLGCREPVRFLTREDDRAEPEEEDFDFFLYTKLTDARELMLDILRDRSAEAALRISMCLSLAHDLQARLRRDCLYEADSLFERYRREGRFPAFKRRLECCGMEESGRYQVMQDLFRLMGRMEPLKEDWPSYRDKLAQTLYGQGKEAYNSRRREFLEALGQELELWSEQLMVYFIFTYFCGSVYSGTPYGKAKLAGAAVLVIQDMAQALWQQSGKLELEDMAEAAHRFSREVEHSDENRALFEKGLTGDPAFRLLNLLQGISG